MTPENKILLKKIGIGAAIVLFLSALTVIIYKLVKKPDDESTDDTGESEEYTGDWGASNSNKNGYDNKGYSFAQVEKMQAWLFKIASEWKNALIVEAIRSTGSIDGKMGDGFNRALQEAIRVGYVKDLTDLYNKSNK